MPDIEGRLEPELFDQSLQAQATGNYLGDSQVLHVLLRNTISDFCEKYPEQETDAERTNVKRVLARRLATILLGKDKNFASLDTWNEPGGIDVFCAHWLGSSEKDPMAVMEHAVLLMLHEILDLADFVGMDGVLEEQWGFQVDAIIDRYVGIFIGLSPPQQAAQMLGDDEPGVDNEPSEEERTDNTHERPEAQPTG